MTDSPLDAHPTRTDRPGLRTEPHSLRILVLDDERTYREYLGRYLERDGLDVRTAETGKEAIAICQDFEPDLLLADWMLRCEMRGIDVGEAVRKIWPDLRILLMTGFPTSDLRAEADRVGIHGFLEKPFALEDLTAAIRSACADTSAAH